MNDSRPSAGLSAPPGAPPKPTGIDEIDIALAELSSLSTADLSEHHDRLAEAHEVLHRALQSDPTPGQ